MGYGKRQTYSEAKWVVRVMGKGKAFAGAFASPDPSVSANASPLHMCIMRKFSVSVTILCLALFCVLMGCDAVAIPGLSTVTPITPPIIYVVATPTKTPTPTATNTSTPLPTATHTPAVTATPFITPPAPGQAVEIAILMYHHLKYEDASVSEGIRVWSVAPDQFAAQLDMYQQQGFHTITFKQLVEFFDRGTPLPTKPLILTVDDGWIDAYTVAFPELTKRGMVANFFVPTRYANAGGELLINWEQIVEMDRAGMEFGGHTISHEDLTKVNLDVMQNELRGAKAYMEEKLGHPTYALSYPFGAFNPRVMAETEAAGYRAAVILCCGYEQSSDIMFALPRIRVSYDDSLDDIAAKLP